MTIEHRERVYPATGKMETVFTRIPQIGVRAEIPKLPAYALEWRAYENLMLFPGCIS